MQNPQQISLSILLAPKLKSYNDMIYFNSQSISMVNHSRIKMKSDQLLKSRLTVSLRLLPPPEVLERRHINGQPSSLDLHSHKHDQD